MTSMIIDDKFYVCLVSADSHTSTKEDVHWHSLMQMHAGLLIFAFLERALSQPGFVLKSDYDGVGLAAF